MGQEITHEDNEWGIECEPNEVEEAAPASASNQELSSGLKFAFEQDPKQTSAAVEDTVKTDESQSLDDLMAQLEATQN